MTYKIEATDPITQVKLDHLTDKPYAIEDDKDDSLIIYFENEENKQLFLNDSESYQLSHYKHHLSSPRS